MYAKFKKKNVIVTLFIYGRGTANRQPLPEDTYCIPLFNAALISCNCTVQSNVRLGEGVLLAVSYSHRKNEIISLYRSAVGA
jgi:hypothetical protein